MNNIILYSSLYGTARRYAEEFSRRTGYAVQDYSAAKDFSNVGSVFFFGGLYAGGVKGLVKTIAQFPGIDSPELTLMTVGLADPTVEVNIENIRASILKLLGKEQYERARIYHLRGGIDYPNLSLKHQVMMKLLVAKAKRIPLEKQTEEVRTMIATYGQKVDFVDFSALDQIQER